MIFLLAILCLGFALCVWYEFMVGTRFRFLVLVSSALFLCIVIVVLVLLND